MRTTLSPVISEMQRNGSRTGYAPGIRVVHQASDFRSIVYQVELSRATLRIDQANLWPSEKRILDVIIESGLECNYHAGFVDQLLKLLGDHSISLQKQTLINSLGGIRSKLNVRRTQEAVDLYRDAVNETREFQEGIGEEL